MGVEVTVAGIVFIVQTPCGDGENGGSCSPPGYHALQHAEVPSEVSARRRLMQRIPVCVVTWFGGFLGAAAWADTVTRGDRDNR
jgi:hypothetical protein